MTDTAGKSCSEVVRQDPIYFSYQERSARSREPKLAGFELPVSDVKGMIPVYYCNEYLKLLSCLVLVITPYI